MDWQHGLARPAPELRWRHAVVDFTARHAVPQDDVLAGKPFTCNGSVFRLQFNADLDPHGLVVMLELDDIPEETAHVAHLQMLFHNWRRPCVVGGYYGILPGTRRCVFCVRLDERQASALTELLETMLGTLSHTVPYTLAQMSAQFQAVTGMDPDAFDDEGQPLQEKAEEHEDA